MGAIYGSSYYTIVESDIGTQSWWIAEGNSQKLGGHLVTVNSSSENKWIRDTFKDEHKHYYEGGKDIYHIGLNRESAASPWKWSSGDPVTYTNFGPKTAI